MMQYSVIRSDPCKSAPSAKSAFYRRTDLRTKSTDEKVSWSICVHQRFFYDVTFQTGFTGSTGYGFLWRRKDEFF